MKSALRLFITLTCWLLVAAHSAFALDLDLKGSLGEGKHKHYVPPISNPLLNETPYITTEIRPVWIQHGIPDGFLGGGHVNIYAIQARVALTDRLGFIANKDGWADLNFKTATGLDDDGFANIAAGLKYALISEPEKERILTVGATYEPPSGRLKAGPIWAQGNGDGFIDFFLSGAESFERFSFQASTGFHMALDGDANNSLFHYGFHMDYQATEWWYPTLEWNGFVNVDEGNRTALGVDGFDVIDFGSTGAGSVHTMAFGSRFKVMDHVMVGAAYEFPISHRKDITKYRATVDLVLYY